MAKKMMNYLRRLTRKDGATRKHAGATGELDMAISQYSNFKLDGIPDAHDFVDSFEERVILRASIHDMLNDAQASDAQIERIKQLDREWQSWIELNRTINFSLVGLSREHEPKSEWWFWIDKLDELSDKERSTL